MEQTDPRSCLFCIPTLSGKLDADFQQSCDRMLPLMLANGIGYGMQVVRGDSFIDKARNRLATHFLEDYPEAQNLFFLDDDIGWPPEKVVEFLARPEPIIAGVYPMKTEAGTFYPVELMRREGHIVEQNGLFLANWAATGFMRIKRSALEAMAAVADVYPEPVDHFGERKMCFSLFEAGSMPPPPERETQFWQDCRGYRHRVIDWRGEDVYFCDRWRAMGGEVWVDPSIEFSHRGSKQWRGTFALDCGEAIAANQPVPRSAIEKMMA